MPALPILRDATIPLLESLKPRDPKTPGLLARQPSIASSAERTIALDAPNEHSIAKRAILPGIIPSYYNTSGPGAGLVVGVVLGSVLGFLFIIWLFWQLTNVNAGTTTAIAGEEEIVVRRRRNSHGNRSRRSTHTEMRHHSRSPRTSGGRSQVIVEERRSRPRSVLVEERRRVPGDDMVEVVEEHSDSYDSRSRSRSRRGSHSGRGYRY